MLREKTVSVVYFSGTGCTRLAAEYLAQNISLYMKNVTLHSIEKGMKQQEKADILVLLFSVHAFNAPQPVYDWISSLPKTDGTPASVISVSGGGDVFPNRACRKSCIHRLEKKGYAVFYEQMLTMPSNIFIETPLPVSKLLLRILPGKTAEIAHEIIGGIKHRVGPSMADCIFSRIGELEKFGARWSGKTIKPSHTCNGCGRCVKNCPVGNIKLVDGKPAFSNQCALCMKCIYSCPQKALSSGMLGKFILPYGVTLNVDETYDKPEAALKVAKGVAWIGVRRYILENIGLCK